MGGNESHLDDRLGLQSQPHHTLAVRHWPLFPVCNMLIVNTSQLSLAISQGSRKKMAVAVFVRRM